MKDCISGPKSHRLPSSSNKPKQIVTMVRSKAAVSDDKAALSTLLSENIPKLPSFFKRVNDEDSPLSPVHRETDRVADSGASQANNVGAELQS